MKNIKNKLYKKAEVTFKRVNFLVKIFLLRKRIRLYLYSLRLFGLYVVFNRTEKKEIKSKMFTVLYVTESPVYAEKFGWFDRDSTFDLEISFREFSDARHHVRLGPIYSVVDAFMKEGVKDETRNRNKKISMVLSSKNFLPGHKMRHMIFHKYQKSTIFDFYGSGIGKYIDDLSDAYRGNMFAVVVENNITKNYNSEKLFDAILLETIPIYYGDVSRLSQYGLDVDGLITFDSFDELNIIVKDIKERGSDIYSSKKNIIIENKKTLLNIRESQVVSFCRNMLLPTMLKKSILSSVDKQDWDRYFQNNKE